MEPAPSSTAAPAETPTEVAIAPTAYAVVQTSRSESTVSGATAIDQNVATVWQTVEGQDPGTHAILRLELGADVPIGIVRLFAGSSGLMGTPTIETSLDGQTWFYFADPGPAMTGPDGWIEVGADPVVVGPVIARYVRIVFANTGETSLLGGLAEIEVWPRAPS